MDVIELIIKNLSLSIDKYESASMAVPGGTSPIKIFDELSKQKLDWSKVQITLVDDRLVDTENDHRVAMSMLIFGFFSNKSIVIDEMGMIKTSFPSFRELFQKLGAKIEYFQKF